MITNDIDKCVLELESLNIVAFPTETVYGLGARADNPTAINKVFKAKSRPVDHPLIVHGSSATRVFECVEDIPQYAYDLANKFWPGPMSLILNRKSGNDLVCDETTGGQKSIALRVPDHEITLELLTKCNFLVAGPSANLFSHVSPTSATHVISEFGEELTVLDGGECHIGVESTIISCLGVTPKILRAGAITDLQISQLLNVEVDELHDSDISKVKVSGNLETHYSPTIPVYVFKDLESLENYLRIVPQENLAYLAYNDIVHDKISYKHIVSSDEEYAHNLYSFFRKAQDLDCTCIVLIAPQNKGLGVAINDRLSKASSDWNVNDNV